MDVLSATNITLTRPELNTTKIEGFAVTNANVTSDSTVTKRELNDLYWVTSEMKIKSTGGNEKKVCLLDADNTKFMNPDTGAVNPCSSTTTFPATKVYVADADVARLRIVNAEGGYCDVARHDGSNPVNIPFASTNPISIQDVAYYNNGRSGLSAAIVCYDVADLKVYIGEYEVVSVGGVTPVEMKLYCNKTHVALVIREAEQTLVKQWTYNSAIDETAFTFTTTGFTYAKVMDPFATNPTLVGYKDDGVYTVVGATVTKVVDLAGIKGMAVNLVVGANYTSGWVYKQADDVCRNQLGKRVATITGDMNLGYYYQTHIIGDAVEPIETIAD